MGNAVALGRDSIADSGESTSGIAVLPDAAPHTELEARILAATLRLVARWGLAKTTIADVAGEADCGRASVYRAFPGGKQELFVRVGRREFDRFFAELTAGVDRAPDFESALVGLLVTASAELAEHDALQFLLAHEPGVVLPFLGFNQIDRLYAAIRNRMGPHLRRFTDDDDTAAWAAEWAARVVLGFLFNVPDQPDLSRREVSRRLVRSYLLPALSPTPATLTA